MKDYKKILEGVVNIISTTEKSDIGFANICTYIGENCPELKESEDERIRNGLIALLKFGLEDGSVIAPGFNETKEQALAWLEKQGKQESAWSEEDEEEFEIAIKTLHEAGQHSSANWLKSLRPQKQWKPSKEQMEAILFVVQHYTPRVTDRRGWDSIKILELMYYEVKKIK